VLHQRSRHLCHFGSPNLVDALRDVQIIVEHNKCRFSRDESGSAAAESRRDHPARAESFGLDYRNHSISRTSACQRTRVRWSIISAPWQRIAKTTPSTVVRALAASLVCEIEDCLNNQEHFRGAAEGTPR